MFQKYNDTPAAICLGIYFLGGIFYVFQLLFMTETWLAGEEIGPEAIGVARVLGFAFLGYNVGLIWAYVNGPDGQKFFFLLVGRTNRHLTQHLAPAFICGKDDPFRRCHNRFGTHRFTTDWLSQGPIQTIVLEKS